LLSFVGILAKTNRWIAPLRKVALAVASGGLNIMSVMLFQADKRVTNLAVAKAEDERHKNPLQHRSTIPC